MALRKREARSRAEEYPSSDGVPMDSERHAANTRTWLIDPLRLWCERTGFAAFVGGNSFVYYGPSKRHDVVGPDMYVVNGGVHRGQASWVVSDEQGLKPTLVMEFLSPTTRVHDQTTKLELYRDKLRVRDYFLVDDGPTVTGYHLHGDRYVAIEPNTDGRLPCASLPLEVGVLEGWVRFFEPDGQLVLTAHEIAEIEHQRANAEHQVAITERHRATVERHRATVEAQRAHDEHLRAEALALELAAARAELERLKAR